jgi:hypothetical protein
VDNQVKAFALKQLENRCAVTDVDVERLKLARRGKQAIPIPERIPFVAEELPPHVIVHANDAMTELVIIQYGF